MENKKLESTESDFMEREDKYDCIFYLWNGIDLFWHRVLRRKKESMAMTLENKLGIQSSPELAREEEKISKQRAMEIFSNDLLKEKPAGRFSTLAFIHFTLFSDIYDFAGKLREINIAKGTFDLLPSCICRPL